jgi:hypothetical protein
MGNRENGDEISIGKQREDED